jgi:hypothetical protein
MQIKGNEMKTITMIQKLTLTALVSFAFCSVSVQAETQESVAPKAKKAPKQFYAGWYMRIRASAVNSDGREFHHHTAGVFGELVQSSYKKDRHDIESYGAATFQVVFTHYDWEELSGDYWSDYRKYRADKADARAVYTFQVRNQNTVDLSNASLKLLVDEAQNVNFYREQGQVKYVETDINAQLSEKFTLVDVDNKRTYAMDEFENADLTMEGLHTRTFRLIRGEVRNKDFDPVVKP